MNESIGIITVGRYLRESIPRDIGVYVETLDGATKIIGIARYCDNSLAAIISDNYKIAVNLDTPLYLSKSSLSNISMVCIKAKARSASSPLMPEIISCHFACEGVPLASYYNG